MISSVVIVLETFTSILEMEVNSGKLDRQLFELFVQGGVYTKITLAHP